jgi:glycosyltransferase involved in cell wall biosynthesis
MLVIIDPSLRSYMGHFLTYDKAIADEVMRFGQSCAILASKSVRQDLASGTRIVPCFSQGLEGNVPDLSEIFYRDLVAGADLLSAPDDATYFLHTCTAAQIEPAARFIKRSVNSKIIILLRYSITINPMRPDLALVERYREALAAIVNHGVADRVHLVTDSDLLRDEYGLITDLPISVVPIPHVGGVVGREEHSPRTMVYLGNARGSKGFAYLQHLVAQIRPVLESGEWAAEFQANVMFRRDRESVIAIPILRNEPVTLWEKELSLAEYGALLGRASLVLIPYMTNWYHAQSSGVFAEAIGTAKPVVVPRGTWMARQLGDSGAGVLFNPGDRVDLVRAVREAMDKIVALSTNAQELQEKWTKVHNPAAFAKALLAAGASA